MNGHPSARSAALWSSVLLAVIAIAVTLGFFSTAYSPRLGYQLSDSLAEVELVQTDAGLFVDLERGEGESLVTPEVFLAQIESRQDNRGFNLARRAFNVTSLTGVLWIAFGLAAQAIFTARMIVQWLASEKAKASTVPVAFWWLSVIGASMLMAYFIWRRDIVGVIGQSTGWFIYVRNLWLIYKHSTPTPEVDADTEPA